MKFSIITIDDKGEFHDTDKRVDEALLLEAGTRLEGPIDDDVAVAVFTDGIENSGPDDPEQLAAEAAEWGMSIMLNPHHSLMH